MILEMLEKVINLNFNEDKINQIDFWDFKLEQFACFLDPQIYVDTLDYDTTVYKTKLTQFKGYIL